MENNRRTARKSIILATATVAITDPLLILSLRASRTGLANSPTRRKTYESMKPMIVQLRRLAKGMPRLRWVSKERHRSALPAKLVSPNTTAKATDPGCALDRERATAGGWG